MDIIIQYLSVNGTIDPGALFSPPFSDISPNGLIAVFNEEQSSEIVSLLDRVNRNAVVVGDHHCSILFVVSVTAA